jgi:amino acid adenylation domain-containing protein
LIVALVGILKAGGAYVPLNPRDPDDRLAFMLQDAQIEVLLAGQRHGAKLTGLSRRLPASSAPRFVWLDSDWAAISQQSIASPLPSVAPGHLAYMIYTSGSTGTPKGVLVTHRALSNIVHAQTRCFDITRECRIAQVNSPSFDISLSEIWGALATGATLCPLPQDQLAGSEVVGWLRKRAVTFLYATPSFLSALPGEPLPALKIVVAGGERCPAELVALWSDGRRFINTYGPTETAIWATWAECCARREQPSIGRPVCNTEAYVLDRWLQLIPVGVPGELCIGGTGLARGYLNRPDITAERFVPHPFSQAPGARLYRTGDLVQYRTDGDLEFLGRLDDQVKIRGYRIELGEIEAVLRQHPEIHEAVVVVREESSSGKRLVGYLTARGQPRPGLTELRSFLKERLPDYMLPAELLWLEALPRNSSGKVDRRALPVADRRRPDLESTFEAPRTVVERVLVSIWAQWLGTDQLGIHDNFFELGGHSLLAIRVIARVQAQLGVELPLRVMFDSPTVAELAIAVEQASRGRTTSDAPALHPIPQKFVQ